MLLSDGLMWKFRKHSIVLASCKWSSSVVTVKTSEFKLMNAV